MSHTVTVKDIKLTDSAALDKALASMPNVKVLGRGTHKLYGGPCEGLGVKLLGGKAANGEEGAAWQYPIVIGEDGSISFDHYNQQWGREIFLDELVQRYTVEKASAEALMSGMSCDEQLQENGDIVLQMCDLSAA